MRYLKTTSVRIISIIFIVFLVFAGVASFIIFQHISLSEKCLKAKNELCSVEKIAIRSTEMPYVALANEVKNISTTFFEKKTLLKLKSILSKSHNGELDLYYQLKGSIPASDLVKHERLLAEYHKINARLKELLPLISSANEMRSFVTICDQINLLLLADALSFSFSEPEANHIIIADIRAAFELNKVLNDSQWILGGISLMNNTEMWLRFIEYNSGIFSNVNDDAEIISLLIDFEKNLTIKKIFSEHQLKDFAPVITALFSSKSIFDFLTNDNLKWEDKFLTALQDFHMTMKQDPHSIFIYLQKIQKERPVEFSSVYQENYFNFFSLLTAFVNKYIDTVSFLRMTILALANVEYQKETGKWPENNAAFVPQYIPHVYKNPLTNTDYSIEYMSSAGIDIEERKKKGNYLPGYLESLEREQNKKKNYRFIIMKDETNKIPGFYCWQQVIYR